MREIEILNRRKPNEKHFLRQDGLICAKIYNEPVHYLKNNKYEEIDNTLVKKNKKIVNKSNSYNVEFCEDYKQSLIKVSKDDYYMNFKILELESFKLKTSKREILKENNSINSCLNDDISISYQVLSNKIKETVIINNSKYSKFNFEIDTNLELKEENGIIVATDKDNKSLFRIEKPFMVDSKDNINNNIKTILRKKNDKYVLGINLDEKWLNNKNTVYPVYLDPTISNLSTDINLYDTYIYPGDTNDVRYQDSFMKVGVERINNNDVINRALIKFDLPTLGTGDEIVYACIDLRAYITTSLEKQYYATIHRVTHDWSESTANWNTMNDKYDNHVESMFYRSPGSVQYLETNTYGNFYDGNITNLVKSWYKDVSNYGIMIKAYNESYDNNDYLMLCSKDNSYSGSINPMPVAEIYYKNMNGLESYWDYKTQSLMNCNSYINTFNGNLVNTFNVGHTIGGSLPITLQLVYNTNDVILVNNTKFGNGYKLNYEQKIKEVSINNTNYLSYLDEDGTTHYFVYNNNEDIYQDEDGLNLKIKKEETQCILSDDSGNKMTFTKNGDTYYLIRIEDIDNNQINISLNQDNSISSITDSFNNSVSISYGSNIIITSPDSITTLYYTNNVLSSVETIKGVTNVTYNTNNLIETISDVSGQKLKYEYYSKSPYKIKKVSQYGINDNLGRYFNMDYGFNTTTITDNKGRNNILIFNDNGNLLSTNMMSNLDDLDSAYSMCSDFSNESYLKNKMISSTIPVKTINNLLTNTSFEKSNIDFTGDSNITLSISNDYAYSGDYSLKCISNSNNASFYQDVNLTKGEYYTFSSFIKSNVDYDIELSYIDNNNETITETLTCDSSNDFNREDITINYSENAASNLKIKVIMKTAGIMYLDDVQLEIGEVANSYSPIENYDFRNGFNDWTITDYADSSTVISDYISVTNVSSNKTALKIHPGLKNVFVLEKQLPLKGREGDLYTFSFWYKNEGIPGYGPICGTNVMLYFKPTDQDAPEHCIPVSENLNVNNNTWQYFSYRSHAMEDYEYVRLVISVAKETNDIYITNLSFNKELTSGDYSYDENGNLITVTDQSNNSNSFDYDSKNQLVGITDSLGKSFKYEYDKNKKDRLINTISSNGISNKTIYDSHGNPIISRLTKNTLSNIISGLYKIRSAGTNKYLKAELNLVLLEANDCSNTIWRFEENNNLFKIINEVNSNYNMVFDNDKLYLNTINSNNTFELEKNTNGSYYIKYNDSSTGSGKVLTVNSNNELEFVHYSEADSNAEFYIELQTDLFLENSSKYDSNNRFVESTIDSGLRKNSYNYNNVNGLLNSTINPKLQETDYTYNNKNQCTKVKQGNIQIEYTYDTNNRLSKISQGDKDYNINYDSFNNVSSINLNNNYTFTSNSYENNNGNLLSTTYGNSNTISFSYDYFDRIKSITKMDKIYSYYYDNNGNLSKVKSNDFLRKYYYDKANRLFLYKNNELTIKNIYDSENNVTRVDYSLDNHSNNVVNTYDDYKLLSTSIDNTTVNYSYDNLNRNTGKNINNIINVSHNFLTNGKRTTSIIDEYVINNNVYKYYYDELFNVTDVYLNSNHLKHYDYDSYNELISETNYDNNTKVDYLYDLSGNIQQKVVKNLQNSDIIKTYNYGYNNSNWEDQLTTFDGKSISYDSIGNITQYGTANLTWINGNELSTYSDNNLNISYEYDDSGIRTKKIVNNVETKYYTINSNIIYELKNNNLISYLYDSDGLLGFDYNNNRYYYVKNMHDDIIGIIDSNGVQIVTYEYDSWGKLLSIKDQNNNIISPTNYSHIANINPFRYRSYYYDVETGLYYLNHRYYNPDMGRFISPDMTLGSNKDILSCNLYAYVSNNPINNIDETGMGLLKNIKRAVKAAAKKLKRTATVIKAVTKNSVSKLWTATSNAVVKVAKAVGSAVVSGVTTFFNTLYSISEAVNNSFTFETQGGYSLIAGSKDYNGGFIFADGIEYSNQEIKTYNGYNVGANISLLTINRDERKYGVYDDVKVGGLKLGFKKYIFLNEFNSDDYNMFIGLNFDSSDYLKIGHYFGFKIGFNIDVSKLNKIGE